MSSFPIVSYLITLMLAAAVCIHGQQTVKDTDDNPVQVGKQYLIQPIKTAGNNGGGIVPAPITVPFCPLGVTQALFSSIPGLPVSFAFIWSGSKETIVNTYSDVTIEFQSETWPACKEFSKFWKVNESSSEPAILIDREKWRKNYWFNIKKAGANTYELATFHGTVGTVPGPWLGAPRLVLTNDTAKILFVKFIKVGDATTDTTSTSRFEKLGLRMFPFY